MPNLNILIAMVVCIFGLGCTTISNESPTNLIPDREYTIGNPGNGTQKTIGCEKMIDDYCNALQSPEVEGNFKLGSGRFAYSVLQGNTKNDLKSTDYLYARAKLRSKDALPADLRVALEAQDYFIKLGRSLLRPPRMKMDLGGRIDHLQNDYDLEKIWNAAVSETVLRRINRRFPGFYRLRDDLVPLEQNIERERIKRETLSEVSRATWSKNPNWKKVEISFEVLREKFIDVIERLDLPDDTRNRWLRQMRSVKLVIPSSIPAIADFECSTTQINAYYYTQLHLITVCAGDFNSEDIMQTLSHELAHSIGVDRIHLVRSKESTFGVSLGHLRKAVCTPKAFICKDWEDFRKNFTPALKELGLQKPDVVDFQRCLKPRSTNRELSADDFSRLAKIEIRDQLSELARSGKFLRLTKERFPLPNGTTAKNPNYLNPCGYKIFSQGEEAIDDELTQLVFFTANYRCSTEKDPSRRLDSAIRSSEEMSVAVVRAMMEIEGDLSPRDRLEKEGFSSPPGERFADVLGSYAYAEFLRDIREPESRRYSFLASSSWQCEGTSVETLFPEENTVQSAFTFDSHSESATRKKEMFSAPIRAALGCREDFEFPACELKFRAEKKP